MSYQSRYPGKPPAVDDLLDTLSNHLRREVVNYFETAADSLTATLDEVVHFCEQRGVPEESEQVRLRLVHTHLPKLADRGWLDYGRRSDDIQYHGHERAEQWLKELRALF
jgi:hypothetical protein